MPPNDLRGGSWPRSHTALMCGLRNRVPTFSDQLRPFLRSPKKCTHLGHFRQINLVNDELNAGHPKRKCPQAWLCAGTTNDHLAGKSGRSSGLSSTPTGPNRSARALTLAGHLLQNHGCWRCCHQIPHHLGFFPHLAAQPFQKSARSVLGVVLKVHDHAVLIVDIPEKADRPGAGGGTACGINVEYFLESFVVPDRIADLQGELRRPFPSGCVRTTISRPSSFR